MDTLQTETSKTKSSYVAERCVAQRGVALVEYAILVALISLFGSVGVAQIGMAIEGAMTTVTAEFGGGTATNE